MTPRSIRQSHEAPFVALWHDPELLSALAHPQWLTTARYEPILRRSLGQGQIDLLFESSSSFAVLGCIRLFPNSLVTRDNSPLIWPDSVARILPAGQLLALEDAIVPWLRAIARGRAMATETIRSFSASERFVQARAAGFVGAVPLAQAAISMAPFVYARRFATGAHVALDGVDVALGQAVLSDLAASFAYGEHTEIDAFALAWYGLTPASPLIAKASADIAIVGEGCAAEAPIVIRIGPTGTSPCAVIDVPTPASWDVVFTFDAADAPVAAQFAVAAAEEPLREPETLVRAMPVGGSAGVIALAIGPEASAMGGCDIDEVQCFGERLRAEGFTVHVVSSTADRVLADAQLVHIFGAPAEVHTAAFADMALARGIDVVFDLPPRASEGATVDEDLYALLHRSAQDDAEIDRYIAAFAAGRMEQTANPQEASPAEFARRTARFSDLAQRAAAILVPEEDLAVVREFLAFERVFSRGAFLEPEPHGSAIAHLVPKKPFAFAHAPIGSRSHVLPIAFAAERYGVPFVIAGPVYDVDYLQTLRAAAPSVVVLPDASPGVVSSIYRRAATYVDAAPRPRSSAGLLRAVVCGALPVLATDSPLARLTGTAAPLFASASPAHCAKVIAGALQVPDRSARIDDLRRRLLPRCDPATALSSVITAYVRAATMV